MRAMNPAATTALPSFASLVPHAPPMVLLDALLHCEPGHAVAKVEIRDEAPFVEDGVLPTLITMEYMAQTIAALIGFEARAAGGEPAIGFLVACRTMNCTVATLPVGTRLEVDVRHVWGESVLGNFDCVVRRDDGVMVATANLSVAMAPPDVLASLTSGAHLPTADARGTQ
jgi:predicted hotdog family 3-hydroxylacyl-ACP dehydratase